MSEPTCIECKQRPAQRLNQTGQDGALFCTLRCAARYGAYVAARDYTWCEKHGWTVEDTCPDCDDEKRKGSR